MVEIKIHVGLKRILRLLMPGIVVSLRICGRVVLTDARPFGARALKRLKPHRIKGH